MAGIHAAIAAGLVPVLLGPNALAAGKAYGVAVCGGRLAVHNVSPACIQPSEIDDATPCGLSQCDAVADAVDGISLYILEGANRSPLEAACLPLLQMRRLGLTDHRVARGLRILMTFANGATTVPVTSDLWQQAVAFVPKSQQPGTDPPDVGDLSLASELLDVGQVPQSCIDNMLEHWPACEDLRPTLETYGAALNCFYSDEERLEELLFSGVIAPYLASKRLDESQAAGAVGGTALSESNAAIVHSLRNLLG
jgi:hypothetical protein